VPSADQKLSPFPLIALSMPWACGVEIWVSEGGEGREKGSRRRGIGQYGGRIINICSREAHFKWRLSSPSSSSCQTFSLCDELWFCPGIEPWPARQSTPGFWFLWFHGVWLFIDFPYFNKFFLLGPSKSGLMNKHIVKHIVLGSLKVKCSRHCSGEVFQTSDHPKHTPSRHPRGCQLQVGENTVTDTVAQIRMFAAMHFEHFQTF